MIIGYGRATYTSGPCYGSYYTTNPTNLSFLRYNQPTVLLERHAIVTVGGGIRFGIFFSPTTLFLYNAKANPTWVVDCITDIIWSKIGDWIVNEIDGQFWTPDGLLVIKEFDSITWDVKPYVPSGWKINEIDGQFWTPTIPATRENCLTGDGQINTNDSVILPMIW